MKHDVLILVGVGIRYVILQVMFIYLENIGILNKHIKANGFYVYQDEFYASTIISF